MDVNPLSTIRPFLPDAVANDGMRASAPAGAALATGVALPAVPAGAQTAAAAASAPASLPHALDLKSAIEAGSKALQGINQALEFQLDPASKMSVVRVVDTETNQVIRQMPSAEFLKLAQQLDAYQAHLINTKA